MFSFIQTNATPIVGFLTLLSNIIFVGVLAIIIVHAETRAKLYAFVHKYILELLFWAVLGAVVGSLVYANIIGFPPCDLCWYQRIFMYPQLIILFIAMRRKDKSVIDYLVPLSVIGGVIALYHSFIQWGFSIGPLIGCASVGGECAKVYVREFSYITIPFMSFTVFAYIIVMKFFYYSHSNKLKNGGK